MAAPRGYTPEEREAARKATQRAAAKRWADNNIERKRESARNYQARRWAQDPDKCKKQNAEWRKNNPDRVKGIELRRYGISIDDYRKMWDAQNGSCAICKNVAKCLHVDHDHKTGRVRGLLCPACNHGLGHFKDDPQRLVAAVAYIQEKGMKQITMVDGKSYNVVHEFSETRALIQYDGVYVFVDQLMGGWDLSGEPAREDEKPILAALLAPTNDQTIVTITKD